MAEGDGVAVVEWVVRVGCVGGCADGDGGSGAAGEFGVAGDEVGVEMGFDDPADADVEAGGGFDVEIDVALRVDDGGFSGVMDEVGGVGETAEIEAFDILLMEIRGSWWRVETQGKYTAGVE